MRGWWSIAVGAGALAGCGRIDFGIEPTAADAAPDAYPLPSIVCDRVAIPVESPADADLAVAGMNNEGMVALWAPRAGGVGYGLRLDNSLAPLGPVTRVLDGASAIGGVADSLTYLLAVIRNNDVQEVVRIDRGLASSLTTDTDAGVLAREALAAEQTGLVRAWLRGTTSGVTMSYVDDDGSTGQDGLFATAAEVSAVAGDDGPDHAHLVWREEVAAGIRRCIAADVDFVDQVAPTMGSTQVITDDCEEVRNASGPPAADSMIIVWRTLAGQLFAKYIASTGDVDTTLSAAGHAVKVRFDGTRYWVAWLEANGTLELAQLELDGTLTVAPLPGRVPAGDEAFELVRHRGRVYLVILLRGELELLETCPG